MVVLSFRFLWVSFIVFFFRYSLAVDVISPSESIRDDMTLVSRDGSFKLGFFSPGGSSNWYLGIWYKNIPVRTVVWVANRGNPINGSSGLLTMNSVGNLVLLNENKSVVWSSNSTKETQSPIAQLLDTGNLVLRDEKDDNPENYLWQSFDYPSDTLLPGMKLGWDFRTGIERKLSAWKNPEDPSPGDFTWEVDLTDSPETVMWKGSKKFFRNGPWNGVGNSGAPELRPNPLFEYSFVSNDQEVYYMYKLKKKSAISMIVLNQTTNTRQRLIWIGSTQTWRVYASVPRDYCDSYSLCGAYGNCIISESPVCQCLDGFKPKVPDKWNSMDWSQGCVRRKPLNCHGTDRFVKFERLKLPDTRHCKVNKNMNLDECRVKCLENCSCMAYTNLDIRDGGSGCLMWFDDLIDIRQFPAGGQDLYIRMSGLESETTKDHKHGRKIAVTSVPAIFTAAGMLAIGYCLCRITTVTEEKNGGQNEDMELPLFDLATIANATNNFSINHKLGEGGFGPVYKGTLEDGQEIAVKRSSRSSSQGSTELKNEVKLIAKLQHRNLVKLLGCCIQGDEKMLIYEYMPNKSLDFFIFDQTRGKLLNWSRRYHIICGIARGLLYLHQDSRLRIIHRDLKASNVLLDSEMNPKISDFGLARAFGGDDSEGNTNTVVGTFGYIAPEYVADGLFSVKSDVFSFGILLLEIISGKRNKRFYANYGDKLIGHVWRLWKECKPLELVDDFVGESCSLSEVVRCIHIGLLCVQQHPEDRPSMASVVLMLGSDTELSEPKRPGFLLEKNEHERDPSSQKQHEFSSTNEITVTLFGPR